MPLSDRHRPLVFAAATRGTLLAAVVRQGSIHKCLRLVVRANQIAMITGPASGASAGWPLLGNARRFAVASVLLFCGAVAYTRIHPRPMARSKEPISKESLMAGVRFIHNRKVLLAAITLDMVAVLLGGRRPCCRSSPRTCCTLGRWVSGSMRAAPAVGAVVTSFAIAHKGPFLRAGRSLLMTVTGFGIRDDCVWVLRPGIPLSLVALMFLGVFDSISVVIRNTLQLTYTPDEMSGAGASIHFVLWDVE